MKRFRLLDIKTPWFWFVSFYRRNDPMIEASIYRSGVRREWWFYALRWEDEPDKNGAYEAASSAVVEKP
jgi:hypothetical protein